MANSRLVELPYPGIARLFDRHFHAVSYRVVGGGPVRHGIRCRVVCRRWRCARSSLLAATMHLIDCEKDDDAWRRPMAERLRMIASQIEAGNVSSIVVLTHAAGQWTQDLRYENQYEMIGAMIHAQASLLKI